MSDAGRAPLLPLLISFLMLLSSLTGCISGNKVQSTGDSDSIYPSIWDRHNLDWETNHTFSYVLERGTYTHLEVREAYIEVDTSEIWEVGPETSEVHLSYWLPSNTLEGDTVPVIAVISPYFSYGQPGSESSATNVVSSGRGEFIFENFVPHGYAFAQVSVFGTEMSSGCFDYRGAGEGLGIHEAVEWLGSQEWSNGNVGLYGKSYEGATQWEAAAMGSPHLKTIVPMSGLIGMHDLMWRNGSMEARGAIMHNGVYGSFGLDGNLEDAQNACEGYMEGYYAGVGAYLTGDNLAWLGSDYWVERHFLTRAIQNYNGSIYIIHGMQDWNVDPHMAFPVHNMMIDAGFEVKGLYGQWGHDYPDRRSGHENLNAGRGAEAFPYTLRWDWADDLLEWFNFYLMDKGPQPRLIAEVQDNMGGWRVETSYPPDDVHWIDMDMDYCSIIGGSDTITTTSSLTVECPEFEEETRIVGTPTFHVEATISQLSTSGHLFVEMVQSSNGMHLGHAVMDLRFHNGGKDGEVLSPGSTVIAKMEFFGMDVIIPEGDGIQLILSQTGEDYIPSPISMMPVSVSMGVGSILSLSSVVRDCNQLFLPPMQSEYPFCIVEID